MAWLCSGTGNPSPVKLRAIAITTSPDTKVNLATEPHRLRPKLTLWGQTLTPTRCLQHVIPLMGEIVQPLRRHLSPGCATGIRGRRSPLPTHMFMFARTKETVRRPDGLLAQLPTGGASACQGRSGRHSSRRSGGILRPAFGGVLPSVLTEDLGKSNHELASAVVCEMVLVLAIKIVATRSLTSRAAMVSGARADATRSGAPGCEGRSGLVTCVVFPDSPKAEEPQ
jgi:hypothetical protein